MRRTGSVLNAVSRPNRVSAVVRTLLPYEFHADVPDAQPLSVGCGLALRGVLRRDPGETVVLDAVGATGGLNRLLVLRGERLLRVLQDALTPTGPSELSIAGSAFAGLGPAPVDLVLHDQVGHRSATLARLVIGR